MLKFENNHICFYVLLSFLLVNINEIYGQKLPEFASQTPQAAALSKYSEYPIGNFTGIPSVNVPLYTIESGDISFPIGLNYHAGGFKVSEEASWVGLGWTLTANGAITRTVNGVEDFNGSMADSKSPYLSANTPRIIDIVAGCPGGIAYSGCVGGANLSVTCRKTNTCINVNGANNFNQESDRIPDYSPFRSNYPLVNGIVKNYTDGGLNAGNFDWEPDIYSINIMGLNGKFVLDQDKNIHFLDKQDVEVNKTANGWMARTNDGFQYYFEKKETSQNFYGRELNGSWYVTKIVSPTKREMNFFYEEDTNYSWQKTLNQSTTINSSGTGFNMIDSKIQEVKQLNVYLTRIEFDNGYVVFTKDTNLREDIKNAKRLKTIQIYNNNNTLIKEFELKSGYFDSNDNGRGFTNTFQFGGITDAEYSYYKKRLKLESVIERNGSNSKNTKFNYSPLNLPNKDSYSMDHWGYYNGQGNASLIAKFDGKISTEYLQPGDAEVNIGNIAGNGPIACQSNIIAVRDNYYSLHGANRETNTSQITANILQDIIYPTGGMTSFEFEANDYSLNTYEYEDFSKDIRKIAKINEPDLVLPDSPMTFDLPSYTLAIEQPKLELVIIGTAPLANTGNMFVEISSPNFYQKYWAEPTFNEPVYNLKKDLPANINGPITLSLSGIPELNANQSTYLTFKCRIKKLKIGKNFAGGLRIKKIVHSDPVDTQKNIIKTYEYGTNYTNQQGQVIEDSFGLIKTPVKYWMKNTGLLNSSCMSTITFSSSNNNSLSINQFSHIGYSKIIENEGINGTLGRTEYDYHNSMNVTTNYDNKPPGVPNSVNWILDGKLKGKSIYNNNNKIVYSESNGYEMKYEKVIKSIYQDGFAGFDDNEGLSMYTSFGDGGFHYCPIFSRWEPMVGSSKRVYNVTDDNYVEIITNYVYNPENLQPSIITTTDSKGNSTITKNYYPNDVNNTNYTTVLGEPLSLVEYNSINQLKRIKDTGGSGDFKTVQPIQVETYNNTELLSRQRTTFDIFGNLTLPNFVKTAKKANSLENRIAYNKYDDKGNPLELQMVNATKIVYIWGYNKTQPIAKIENAAYNDVSSFIPNLQNLSNTGTESNLLLALSALRNDPALANAMVTIYTYKPLIGLSSIIDPKGLTSYYEYDSFNRLQYIKDQDLNVLQKYCYNYRGQQTDCSATGSNPITTYTNSAQSTSFTKSCAAGSVGSSHLYSVPAGTYSSTVSQADADTKAANDIVANGQIYANANGTCTLLPPAAPTGLSLLSASTSFMNFSWAPVAGAVGYKFFKDGGTPITTTATSGSFSGLSASTSYAIGVLAYNASGDGLSSVVSMSTTLPTPTGLSFTSATASSVSFSWTAVAGAISYQIYKNGTYISTVSGNTSSLSGLNASTAYSVQLLASNASGNSPLCPLVSMSTVLGAPTGLALTSVTSSSINFSWTAVAGAIGYKIYKGSDAAVTITGTSGSFSGLTPSTNYSIRVLAYNASGDGMSSLVSMSTASLPAPTGLTFISAGPNSINFSWAAVAGATSYKIYKDGAYVSSVTTPTGSLSGLTIATAYSIQVLASYNSADGALCSAVSMATKLGAPTGLSLLSASTSFMNFSWAPVAGAVGYKFFKDGGTPITTTATSGSFSGLSASTSYAIGVLAYNASGDGLSSVVSMSTTLPTPTGLSFTSATASSVSFSWTAVAGATSYQVYKDGTYISTVTGTTSSLSGLNASTAYSVQILASNASGNSPLCTAISMSTAAVYTNKGSIYNNTGRTMGAATLVIKANGNTMVSVNMPSLANGATFEFSTAYSMPIYSNGTFIMQLFSPIAIPNYFYMQGGSTSPNGFFTNISGGYQATVTSPGAQYSLTFILK